MAEIKIHFICEAMSTDSPPTQLIQEISKQLVEPALPTDMECELSSSHFSFNNEGTLDHYTVDTMATDDLVIADLTGLSDTALFILGARDYRALPIVYICDEAHRVPRELRDEPLVRYSIDKLGDSVAELRDEIQSALGASWPPRSPRVRIPPLPPREMRLELAKRIEATAEAIRLLRINSVGNSIDELLIIAHDLKNLRDDKNPSRLREAADKALKVLNALLDELATQPGARMAITGAISLIVGGTGVSGASAFGAGLAFWYGKDMFTKFINAWGKRGADRPKPKSRSKPKN